MRVRCRPIRLPDRPAGATRVSQDYEPRSEHDPVHPESRSTRQFHPGKVEPKMRLLGSAEVLAKLQAGEAGREILEQYHSQLEHFRKIRAKYLLYK